MTNPARASHGGAFAAPIEAFKAVLAEFAASWAASAPRLEVFAILATPQQFGPPTELALRVQPRSRARPWDALQFRLEGETIYVADGGRIGGVPEFRDYLELVKKAGHLESTLRALNAEDEAPIEGVLRTIDPHTLGAHDVAVRVTEAEYAKLDADDELTIVLRETSPQRLAPLAPDTDYKFLTVEGDTWVVQGNLQANGDGTYTARLERCTDVPSSLLQ